MAAVSTKFKRLFIRSLKWDSESSGLSFFETIKAAAIAKFSASSSGSVLIGTSSKGHSVSLSIPGSGRGFSPTDITECVEEILQAYDAAKAYLISEGNPTPSDGLISTEMLEMMQPVTEFASDYTELRTS